MKCSTDNCQLPAYYLLDDGRGYCTMLHAERGIGGLPAVAHAEDESGHRRLELIEPEPPPIIAVPSVRDLLAAWLARAKTPFRGGRR